MVYNGDLIVGGYFTSAGGVTCNYVARWADDIGCCNSLAFTIDNRSGSVRVTASAIYDERVLDITALGYDTLTGTYVTTGVATYDLAPLPYSGNLTYTGSCWVAQVNLNANPPAPGQHPVRVNIRQSAGTTWFSAGASTGTIQGHVKDMMGAGIVGADVRLYDGVSFFTNNPRLLDSTASGTGGSYALNGVAAGSYVVLAEAAGFIPMHQLAVLARGATLVVDLVLPREGQSLALLKSAMQSLYERTIHAMDAETHLMPELTQQAADDLNAHLDGWDVARAIGGILSGASSMGPDALRWIAEHAARPTIEAVIVRLVAGAAVKTCVTYQIEQEMVRRGTTYLLPSDQNGWRRYEYQELTQLANGPYAAGSAAVEASNNEFQQTAGSIQADPNFDFAAAWRAVAAQDQLLARVEIGRASCRERV